MIKNSRFERFRCVTFHFTVTVCVCVCANMWRKIIHNWFFECKVLICIEWLLYGKCKSDSLFFNPFVVSKTDCLSFFHWTFGFYFFSHLNINGACVKCYIFYCIFPTWNLKLLIIFILYLFFICWIINCLTFQSIFAR